MTSLARRALLAALPALALAPAAARAQAASAAPPFPQRPGRIVVPFTPGGSPDVLARMLADESARRWPQNAMVVENRPGAAGSIAAEFVARSAPDGHTILLMSNNIVAVNPHIGRMSVDPLTDLVPVAMLARSPLVVLVGADAPVRDLAGLIALARERPGEVSYASAGNGSPHHLAMALLGQRAGVRMTHVPYRGTAPGLTDVAGGRVTAMASPVGTALALIGDGRVRPLAAAGAERLPWLPDVPTVAEAGPLPGFDANTWLALAVPRGTPPATVATLAEFAASVVGAPRAREQLDRQGIVPASAGPEALGALWRSDHAEWGAVIREARITSD